MRSAVHGGSKTMLTVTSPTPRHQAHRILHPARHLAGDRAAGRGQRHVDVDVLVVVDVDPVDQPQLVDVGRDLRIVDGLQRRDDVARSAARAPPAGSPSRWRAASPSAPCGHLGLGRCRVSAAWCRALVHRHHAKKLLRFLQASARRSTSSTRVIEREGGATGGGRAEAGKQRLGAVGPGPHRDAGAVDDRRDVVRVGAGHVEGDDGALALRLAVDASGC